jgi:hypothetical protein
VRRALGVLALLAVPAAAEACAVCGAAVDRNRTAFLVTTILLSFLPVVLMGAGIAWIAVRSRRGLAADLREGEVQPEAPQKGRAPAGGPAGATW